jgi:hypothetical protein
MAKAAAPLFVQAAMLPAQQLELSARVGEWDEVYKKLTKLKEEEDVLRSFIIEKWFPEFKEGTHTGSMQNGMNLKCGMGMNRNVIQEQVVAAYAFATMKHNDPEVIKKAAALKELLDRVFRVKYELNLSEYRAVSDEELKKLGDLVTEKPAKPTLKYEEKKT